MAINTSIYGTPEQWLCWDYNTDYDIKNLPRFVNFSGTTDIIDNTSMLKVGITAGKTEFNVPIDKSIAMLGVDDNCSLVHQTWYKRGATVDESFAVEMKRDIVNPLAWGWQYRTYSQMGGFTTILAYNDYNSWAYKQENRADNPDTFFSPCASMPIQTVHIIFVRALSGKPGSDVSSINCDLYTYLNAHTQNNPTSPKLYQQYPYIQCIFLQHFYRNKTEVTNPTSKTEYYRGMGGDIYVPSPCILNELNEFVDPDTPDKTYNLFRYSQPTKTSTNTTNSIYLSPYDTGTYSGSSLTIDRYPTTIFGNVAYNTYDVTGTGSTYNKYYLGLVGQRDKLHTEFFKPTERTRAFRWYSTLDDFGGIEGFEEYCKQQTAYLGGFFTESYSVAVHEPYLDSDYFFLGIIDDNGVTHGEYSQGKANKEQKQWNWTDFNENNYDPDKKPEAPDREDPSDPYIYNKYNNIGLETGNYYAMTADQIKGLITWCNEITDPDGTFVPPEVQPTGDQYSYEQYGWDLRKLFNGSYPAEQIISLMFYPFAIDKHMGAGTLLAPSVTIKLANTTTKDFPNWYGSSITAVRGMQLSGGNQFAVFTTEGYDIERRFGDFRDFEPYTSMSVMIPYHGTVNINAGDWYDHKISTTMVIDIITGASTTFIERDGQPIETLSGQVGTPIQLVIRNVGDYATGLITNSQNLNQQKLNVAKSVLGAVTSTALASAGASTGNVAMTNAGLVGALTSFGTLGVSGKSYINTRKAIEHTKAGTVSVSCNSPAVSMYQEPTAKLVITYPRLLEGYNSTIYGKTVGFACETQGTINTFTGYSVFSGANLDGINAPDIEKNMIFQKLTEGIII